MNEKAQDKKRTTIYISPDVLEYLAIRRVKGAGSVSQQLEDMVRAKMPKRFNRQEIAELEARELEGYASHPQGDDEVTDWLGEQAWE